MIDYTALEDTIIDVLSPEIASFGQLIVERQDADRPSEGFTSFYILTPSRLGIPYRVAGQTPGSLDTITNYVVPVRFTSYGIGARNNISTLAESLSKLSIASALREGGLTYSNYADLLDIPSFLSTKWEETAQLTARFHLSSCSTEANVGTIDTVILDSQILDVDDTVIVSDSDTITGS